MTTWIKTNGTQTGELGLGFTGPKLKNDAGNLAVKTADDNSHAALTAAAVLAANASDEMARLQSELSELKAKSADLADQFLRAKAEAENARRRAEEDIAKARKFGIEGFAESLLPVCDSLDAALALPNATAQQLREGSDATLRQLTAALERNKVVAINPPAGEKFNPNFHQAISVAPAEQEPNTVVAVLQKGYVIADRILRPALVTVTAPK